MLGQTEQPLQSSPLAERMLEKRSAGLYSYLAATPVWYSIAMATLRNWRIESETPGAIDGKPVTIAVAKPATKETAADSPADGWVKSVQSAGFGIVVSPEPGPSSKMFVVKHASVAQDLTADSSAFVLSEPKTGWVDASFAQLAAFPVFLAVGIAVVMAAWEGLKR